MSCTKYCQTQGADPFDWHAFLRLAHPGNVDADIVKRSGHWVCCAVGNQCDRIPRELEQPYAGAPLDGELRLLGTLFYQGIRRLSATSGTVFGMHRETCIELLAKIEQRSAYILESLDQSA